MTEETKEILFQLEIVARKHTIKVTDTGNIETMPASVVHELRLNNYSAKILLNYITNLQKENENLKEKVHNQKLANAYATIQINKLQTRLKTYKRRKTAETQKKRIYKQRNEKAVEYIKNTTLYGFRSGKTLLTNYLDDLLNILQGGDEE